MPEYPRGAVRVHEYAALDQYVRAFVRENLGLLLVIGSAGSGKSWTVRESLGNACWIGGHVTPLALYAELYRHRDQLVVLDDADGLYEDRCAVRILKQVCQTDRRKTVGWFSSSAALKRLKVPKEFETSSKVCLILNQWKTLDLNGLALLDRGHIIHFTPTAEAVHDRAAGWFWDQKIYDFVSDHLHVISSPSLRDYVLASELKNAEMDWRGRLLERWGLKGRRLLAMRLLADPAYPNRESQARAFIALGGGCRSTFFTYVRNMAPRMDGLRVQLCSNPPDEDVEADPKLLELMRRRMG